jgi:anti-sigma B factor antagonist
LEPNVPHGSRRKDMTTRIATREIDPASADAFRAEVDAAVARAPDTGGQVVLDFTDVEFIDSTGLTVLIDAYRTLGAQDRTLSIANPAPHIARLFEVTGLEQFLLR